MSNKFLPHIPFLLLAYPDPAHFPRRKYTNGSVLRMHVDTVGTHVVSAIINVDQDVEKDWPLLILDHQGEFAEFLVALCYLLIAACFVCGPSVVCVTTQRCF